MKSYPFAEFREHFEEIAGTTPHGHQFSLESNVLRVMDYMSQKYADPEEQREKMKIFIFISQYLSEYMDRFDTGDYAVQGGPQNLSLVREHLLKAVHYKFTAQPLSEMKGDPDPGDVIILADAFRERGAAENDSVPHQVG